MADIFAQQEALARRRRLLDVMEKQNMQSPIVGHTGVGQALAKLGTAYILGNKEKAATQEASDLRRQYQSELGDELRSYMDKRQGRPGETMSDAQAAALMQNDVAPQLAEPVQANPREAIMQALTSRFPELQAAGQADMAALAKQEQETFSNPITERGPDGKPVAVQYGNRGTRRVVPGALPFERGQVVGERVVDPFNPTQVQADLRAQYDAPQVVNGDVYQRENTGTNAFKKLDNAPQVNLTTNTSILNKGQKAGLEAWSKATAEAVSELNANARQAVNTLSAANQLEALEASGINSGPTANIANVVQGLAQAAGIKVDADKLGNSQAFDSVATQAWAAMMQQNGGARGLVKEESEKIARSLPSLLQSPEGRARIIRNMRAMSEQTIETARTAAKEYQAALQAEDVSLFTGGLGKAQLPTTEPIPAAAGAAGTSSTGAIPVEQWLKGN